MPIHFWIALVLMIVITITGEIIATKCDTDSGGSNNDDDRKGG